MENQANPLLCLSFTTDHKVPEVQIVKDKLMYANQMNQEYLV